jgi:hypothetical protein
MTKTTTTLQIITKGGTNKPPSTRVCIMLFDPNQQLNRVFLSGQNHDAYASTRALAITALSMQFAILHPWAISPTFIPAPEPVSGSINDVIYAMEEGAHLIGTRTLLCAEYALARHMKAIGEPCTAATTRASGYSQLTLWVGPTLDLAKSTHQHMPPYFVTWGDRRINATLQVVGPCGRCKEYDNKFGFYRELMEREAATSLQQGHVPDALSGPVLSPNRRNTQSSYFFNLNDNSLNETMH